MNEMDPRRVEESTEPLAENTLVTTWFHHLDDTYDEGWYATLEGNTDGTLWEPEQFGPYDSREEALNAARQHYQEVHS